MTGIPLTQRQYDLMLYLQRRPAGSIAPSYKEIAPAIGAASISTVNRLVNALVERGYLHRLEGRARTLVVLRRVYDPLEAENDAWALRNKLEAIADMLGCPMAAVVDVARERLERAA